MPINRQTWHDDEKLMVLPTCGHAQVFARKVASENCLKSKRLGQASRQASRLQPAECKRLREVVVDGMQGVKPIVHFTVTHGVCTYGVHTCSVGCGPKPNDPGPSMILRSTPP